MTKIITYGTYDLLHYGHIRLLERAKALGDYLIVGVTADDFDKSRGKINVQQSLMERVENVRATGLADEIIIEEYEGQKIDDIRRMEVDIFTVGSDWKGKFDYLQEYCKVVYLDRTAGVSSSEIRTQQRVLKLGLVGESHILTKVERESAFVNGIEVTGVYSETKGEFSLKCKQRYLSYIKLLENVDAVYIISNPTKHYEQIKEALIRGKHVLCESPITLSMEESVELYELAKKNNCVLMDAIKTAYSTAYSRLLVLAKSGVIGKVVSVDTTCTSLEKYDVDLLERGWSSILAWGPTAILPIFQLLGTNYTNCNIVTKYLNKERKFDSFTKISLFYKDAVASLKVANGVKSEGELIISGEKGYIYVPAPWWKTDYFEIRYENQENNRRYFYQLDGEGIRYMLVAFCKTVNTGRSMDYVGNAISEEISRVMNKFWKNKDIIEI